MYGGGTALLYRDSLHVKKIDAGEKESFEFWSGSSNSPLYTVYRPPYSDEHKVPTSTFFSEFADNLESIVLCREQLILSAWTLTSMWIMRWTLIAKD